MFHIWNAVGKRGIVRHVWMNTLSFLDTNCSVFNLRSKKWSRMSAVNMFWQECVGRLVEEWSCLTRKTITIKRNEPLRELMVHGAVQKCRILNSDRHNWHLLHSPQSKVQLVLTFFWSVFPSPLVTLMQWSVIVSIEGSRSEIAPHHSHRNHCSFFLCQQPPCLMFLVVQPCGLKNQRKE